MIADKLRLQGLIFTDHWRHGDLLLPEQKKLILPRRGDHFLIGTDSTHNLITDEGVNHILNVEFNGAAQVPQWYVGVFEGNYTPVVTETAATVAASATECTAYTSSTRLVYTEAPSTARSMTNSANKATFTFNASKTIYGALLISQSPKAGTSGVLFGIGRFGASRNVANTDQLDIAYTING